MFDEGCNNSIYPKTRPSSTVTKLCFVWDSSNPTGPSYLTSLLSLPLSISQKLSVKRTLHNNSSQLVCPLSTADKAANADAVHRQTETWSVSTYACLNSFYGSFNIINWELTVEEGTLFIAVAATDPFQDAYSL